MDDVRAVLDAVGSERAALMGVSEGGPMSMLFAATYPERTQALLLCRRRGQGGDHRRLALGRVDARGVRRGDGASCRSAGARASRAALSSPTIRTPSATTAVVREAADRRRRRPRDAVAFMRMAFEIDVRDVVPAVRVPTLDRPPRRRPDLPRRERALPRRSTSRAPATSSFPATTTCPGSSGSDEILAEIREFLTGVREAPEPDRVLATVLFTDIVGSTERADGARRPALARAAARRTTQRSGGSSSGSAGARSTPPATASSRASTVRRGRSAAQAQRSRPCAGSGLEIRAGLHTGECEIVGDKLAGIAVHIGARVAGEAGPGEVLVSSTVRDLVAGSGLEFEDRGEVELKGVPGEWRLYARQRRLLSSRSMRRLLSRSAMSRRLSRSSFPRPSASSTFARPFLK